MYVINLGSLWNWNLWLRSDKQHLLNIGKIHQSIGLGGIESMALLKRRSANTTTTLQHGLAKTDPKKWWHDIKSLTRQDTFGKREWYHQFLSDVITSPAELATQINVFFTSITRDWTLYVSPNSAQRSSTRFAYFLRRGFILLAQIVYT